MSLGINGQLLTFLALFHNSFQILLPFHFVQEFVLQPFFFFAQGLEAGIIGGDAGHFCIDGLQAGFQCFHVRIDAVVFLLLAVVQFHGLLPGLPGFLFMGFGDGLVPVPVCVLLHVVGEIAGLHQDFAAAGKGENGIADPIQKVAVVGDGEHAALEIVQVVFQNLEGVDIQVVGGFIKQQHVGGGHEDPQQVQASALAAGQLRDPHPLGVSVKEEQLHHLGRGDDLTPGVFSGLCTLADVLDGPQAQIHVLGFLGEITDFDCVADGNGAAVRANFSRDQVE